MLPPPPSFAPDAITREVLADVEAHFGDHYGSACAFDWPVTREQALVALSDFMAFRLQDFGRFQDAMWADEPFLYHGLLSSSLNLRRPAAPAASTVMLPAPPLVIGTVI